MQHVRWLYLHGVDLLNHGYVQCCSRVYIAMAWTYTELGTIADNTTNKHGLSSAARQLLWTACSRSIAMLAIVMTLLYSTISICMCI